MRAATYRSFLKAEEQMIRAAMPRTSAADPAVAAARTLAPREAVVLAQFAGTRLVAKLAEVARVA